MKTKITTLVIAFLLILSGAIQAQNVISVTANNSDISDNLNLEAIATLFGESKNLEQFEEQLNNPKNKISNLDLNEDGYVDYIRVVEHHEDGTYLVTLQDVIGKDLYQDIATIDVERNTMGDINVQIVGNPYIYGSNYIIDPIYVNRPLIFSYFWNPYYRLWSSPYYWNHYPYYYRTWHTYALYKYRRNIQRFIRPSYYYRYPDYRRNHRAFTIYNKIRRNDYERRHPNKSFNHRFNDMKNRHELERRRNTSDHYVRSGRVNDRYKSNNGSRTIRNNNQKYNRSNNRSGSQVKRNENNSNRVVNNRGSNVNTRVLPSKSYKPKRTTTVRSTGTPSRSTVTNKPVRTSRNSYVRSNSSSNKKAVRTTKSSSSTKRAIRTKPPKNVKKTEREKRK
ncbi:MAG: hypothetical protein JXR71_13195 [Bacteroidales bacterium]|nr:hypothetical protein [Bacteroidales bacterium]